MPYEKLNIILDRLQQIKVGITNSDESHNAYKEWGKQQKQELMSRVISILC
jgi:hypothetical protein